VSTIQPKF